MVKKFKAAAQTASTDSQLASAVRESAQQIWLAGLGAFAKAQDEGAKVFEALVKEGSTLQRRTKSLTEGKIGDVTGKVSKVAGEISKQATEGWDKLEQVFEDRVARSLKRIGVPTSKEVKALVARVEELQASVAAMSGGKVSKVKKAAVVKAAKPVKIAKVASKAAAKVKKVKSVAIKSVATKARAVRKAVVKAVK